MAEGFRVVGVEHGVEELELVGNGLKVLLLPDPSVPVVASCVVYHVGSRNEATGHTGATHLLEHLLFKGSSRYNAQAGTAVARVLERVGASPFMTRRARPRLPASARAKCSSARPKAESAAAEGLSAGLRLQLAEGLRTARPARPARSRAARR